MKKVFKCGMAFLLALLIGASLCVFPASASNTGFNDVSDPDMAIAIESLRLMGILDGYGDGTFRPDTSLTRAQFSKMVVYAQDGSKELGLYSTYTIFPDVRPSHWAAGYINMASRGLNTINGFADGNFRPDDTITGGQAVTILMRLLGYSDADVGAVWPDGYMAMAATIGLTDGVSISAYGNLSRGQAALLFANLFLCDTKESGSYAGSVAASVIENAVLMSSNATASDGTTGAMQLGSGSTYKMASTTSSGLLNGRQGTLLLNKDGKVMTFIPDQSGTSQIITVSEATALYIKDTAGKQYAISADTKVFRNGQEQVWSDVFAWVNAGSSITLHTGVSGNIDHVFIGSATSAVDAIVIASNGSTAGFEALANSSSYAIYKNGLPATRSDLQAYDVASYDGATNAIRVSDMRLSGYYESCYPNTKAPSTVTVMGTEFSVLPSAVSMLSDLELGQNITLLLTEDLQVAGAVEAVGTSARGNVIGIATSVSTGSATVMLFNGLEVSGTTNYSQSRADELVGQIVKVSSGSAGAITLSKVSGGTSSDLDLGSETIGSTKLADNVMIYETVAGGALRAISLDDIPGTKVNSDKITYMGKNWRGDASVLVLSDVTGNNYTYGRASVVTTKYNEYDDQGNVTGTSSSHTIEVSNGTTTVGPFKQPNNNYSGEFIGIAPSVNGQQVAGVKTLTRLKDVPNSAWLNETTISYEGKTYTVAADVACYHTTAKTWISLATAHAYDDHSTLYVDNYNVVRVVAIG